MEEQVQGIDSIGGKVALPPHPRSEALAIFPLNATKVVGVWLSACGCRRVVCRRVVVGVWLSACGCRRVAVGALACGRDCKTKEALSESPDFTTREGRQ